MLPVLLRLLENLLGRYQLAQNVKDGRNEPNNHQIMEYLAYGL